MNFSDIKYNNSKNTKQIIQLENKNKVSSFVVLISNLPLLSKINVEHLHNLFSCFGNIKCMLFLSNSGKCFIQFTHKIFAETCLQLGNQIFFMGEKLKISFSKRKKLDLRQKKNNNSKKYNQIKRVKKIEQRFKCFKSAILPITSDSLLIIASPKQKENRIKHKQIYALLRNMDYQPKKIMILKGLKKKILIDEFIKREKIKNVKKALFSIYQYNNIPEAMKIISQAHGLSDNKIVLDISFSFYRTY